MLSTQVKTGVQPTVAGIVAPGHRYDPQTGNGIEWTPDIVRLWLRRNVIAEVPTPEGSMWDFWYQLRFPETFPQVTHWWFGAPWTGRVRLWGPTRLFGGSVAGFMQFVDEDCPMLHWSVRPGNPPQISTPLPPLHAAAINLPLRSVLAAYAAGILNGRVAPGAWRVAASLVARDDLYAAFPNSELGWRLEGSSSTLRGQLCVLQSIPRE